MVTFRSNGNHLHLIVHGCEKSPWIIVLNHNLYPIILIGSFSLSFSLSSFHWSYKCALLAVQYILDSAERSTDVQLRQRRNTRDLLMQLVAACVCCVLWDTAHPEFRLIEYVQQYSTPHTPKIMCRMSELEKAQMSSTTNLPDTVYPSQRVCPIIPIRITRRNQRRHKKQRMLKPNHTTSQKHVHVRSAYLAYRVNEHCTEQKYPLIYLTYSIFPLLLTHSSHRHTSLHSSLQQSP